MIDRSSLTNVVNSCTNKGDNKQLYRVLYKMIELLKKCMIRHMISFNVLREF